MTAPRVPGEPPFFDLAFRRVVSLGANCEPAHQLRLNGLHDVAGLFDWLVTPLDAIPRILADDGARLAIEFGAVHEGTSVRCRAYDVLYHHEFPRDEANRIVFSADAIERCRGKLVHKWSNFVAACQEGGPLLFVRLGPETDLPWDRCGPEREPVRSADLNALAAALTGRFPRLDFRVLVISLPGGAEHDFEGRLDPRLRIHVLPSRNPEGWAITDTGWRAILRRIRRSPAASPGDARGETLYWFAGAPVHELSGPGEMRPTASSPQVDPVAAVETGRRLWSDGRANDAVGAFAAAFAAGYRHPDFLRDYLGLLSGETRYAEVIALASGLPATGDLAMLCGHAKLALAFPRADEIAAAEARERSPAWLGPAAVLRRARLAVQDGRPFSFVRVGDGEARFLVAARPDLFPDVEDREAAAMGALVWENWFGETRDGRSTADDAALAAAFEHSVAEADILGASTARRLREDTGHYGYLAAQEHWLRGVRPDPARLWTDALAPRALHELSPYLAALLGGLDFVGVISPHPGLASALAARFGLPRAASYVIPSEGRLPTAADTRAAGPHFPDRYRALLDELTVPRRGALFLVAAGLLGKIYCQRIKELGGVALDIGALADAWMGFETRSGQMSGIEPLPAPAVDGPAPRPMDVGSASAERNGPDPSLVEDERRFGDGEQDLASLRRFGAELIGAGRYAELVAYGEALGELPPELALERDRVVGHARLGLDVPKEDAIAKAAERERQASWLTPTALLDRLRNALVRREPFAFIRLGDGEARFLLAMRPELRLQLSAKEARAICDPVWTNWFGVPMEAHDPRDLADLLDAYETAVRDADVLGVTDAARLSTRPNLFGYLAAQERWVETLPPRPDRAYASALAHWELDRASPFLRDLLAGQEVVGVVSPHADLAGRLSAHLGIRETISHLIPGEANLDAAGAGPRVGAHFPRRYRELMAGLAVSRPGTVFLVAGGLLGKVYCGRVRALGGVAIDIGSLADGWMGLDTRHGQMKGMSALPCVALPRSRTSASAQDGADTTYACLSLAKTSSMALTAALHGAGFADAVHLHFLGSRSLRFKQTGDSAEPMVAAATIVARRLSDPAHRFRIVTCFRDPIARWLAQAFHAADGRPELGRNTLDGASFVRWVDGRFGREISTDWADDNLRDTFGFDFRRHPFDRNRRSIRFVSERARILVLRFEDEPAGKESELAWLLDQEGVTLPSVNRAADKAYAATYKAFADAFEAPAAWLETFYDTELIRHLYTEAERDSFRARWSRRPGR